MTSRALRFTLSAKDPLEKNVWCTYGVELVRLVDRNPLCSVFSEVFLIFASFASCSLTTIDLL